MQSHVESIWPIVGCLTQLEDSLHKRFNWSTTNERMAVAAGLIGCDSVRRMLKDDSLRCIATEDYERITAFLKEYGCLGEISPFTPRTFNPDVYRVATAARMLVSTRWKAAKACVVTKDGTYQAFTITGSLEKPHYNIGWKSWVSIYCDDGVEVRVHIPELEKYPCGTVEVTIPCVSLKCANDVSWAVGQEGNWVGFVTTLSGSVFGSDILNTIKVEQAIQTSGLELDETGATATSVAAMQFCLGTGFCPREVVRIVIDKPFDFIMSKAKYEKDIMTGFLAEDSWRKV